MRIACIGASPWDRCCARLRWTPLPCARAGVCHKVCHRVSISNVSRHQFEDPRSVLEEALAKSHLDIHKPGCKTAGTIRIQYLAKSGRYFPVPAQEFKHSGFAVAPQWDDAELGGIDAFLVGSKSASKVVVDRCRSASGPTA